MTKPIAYDPQHGYMYQILIKTPYDRAWEHLDYAEDKAELKRLIKEYDMAHGAGHVHKAVLLPRKYWNKKEMK